MRSWTERTRSMNRSIGDLIERGNSRRWFLGLASALPLLASRETYTAGPTTLGYQRRTEHL